MVNPPNLNNATQDTIDQYNEEELNIYNGLKVRAKILSDGLNSINGITCNEVAGSMYAFPRIYLPENYIKEAQAEGIEPDMKYCLQLLNETGIMIVPGSGFGQVDGTYHFRITNLIKSNKKMEIAINEIKKFTEKIIV